MAPQVNKPKPVTTLRCSSIKASIWKNEGMKGPFYNVTVARSYKASDGMLKDSESFGLADLDALVVVAQQAKVWIAERSGR
ncbi:MAG: hypothetical protein JSR31_08025 [Nitrospira sp.]|nr:hypothetical protein [Nitrospira sp.]